MTTEENEHVTLSWKLIEWKVAYYLPEKVHASRIDDYTIDDDVYDQHERHYLTLCRQLGKPNTIVHKGHPGFDDVSMRDAMMEVDVSRPSVQLVLKKLGAPKARRRRKCSTDTIPTLRSARSSARR